MVRLRSPQVDARFSRLETRIENCQEPLGWSTYKVLFSFVAAHLGAWKPASNLRRLKSAATFMVNLKGYKIWKK
jgi:hypothetical protein